MSQRIFQLSLGSKQNYKLEVNPTVIMQILDSYYRREENSTKIIGTLLGTVSTDTVSITNCFAVPIKDDSTDIDKEMPYHDSMLRLNKEVYSDEIVIGAFLAHNTQDQEEIFEDAFNLIGKYSLTKYSSFVTQENLQAPLVLSLNPFDLDNKFNIKAYTTDLSLGVTNLGIFPIITLHYEISFQKKDKPYEIASILMNQEDKQAIDFEFLNLNNINALTGDIVASLEKIQQKIQRIVDQKEQPDEQFGQQVKQLISFSSSVNEQNLESLREKQQQDNALLQFITTLAKTQNTISEKLEIVKIN
ncbi:hypothetical protein PPERSA_04955 [Pseudocohnilembus persalinus]|uniref:JAB1/MPN/MOV34 metalloenzyme domain-containing protein n=1 Tax=Pseudocohnilembus persalinus TaxID=266149 RepID=A0A0V0QVW8_PSEPJ|nr:hypothetical protein PPERSA_04955 [Pseudocohnilembus persalinus]|eukprot:KRX06342.1 hypothetical protein PPERSA_04955 [Pseudocohnilembus persalinus]